MKAHLHNLSRALDKLAVEQRRYFKTELEARRFLLDWGYLYDDTKRFSWISDHDAPASIRQNSRGYFIQYGRN